MIEENKIISKDDSKSKSLEKINKYKDENIEINKITNNRFVTSKSYRKIDEEENKNEKKEEKRKTSRFGFQNKEGDIPEKKIEEIKDNKLLEPDLEKDNSNIEKKVKEKIHEESKRLKYKEKTKQKEYEKQLIETKEKQTKETNKLPEKEERYDKYKFKDSSFKENINQIDSWSKYPKENVIPKEIDLRKELDKNKIELNNVQQKDKLIMSKSYKNLEGEKAQKKEEQIRGWRFNIKNKEDEVINKKDEKENIKIKDDNLEKNIRKR